MATLNFTASPHLIFIKQKLPSRHSTIRLNPLTGRCSQSRRRSSIVGSYKVKIEHGSKVTELVVEDDESILSKALEEGLDVPHDCKLGVCMTCPARIVSGTVDQSEGMLSDDVIERGYALLCVAYPKSDCSVSIIVGKNQKVGMQREEQRKNKKHSY